MNTKRKGTISEMKAAAKLTEHDCIVSFPVEEGPYDLIADDGDDLYRIQVKTGDASDGSSEIGLRRVSHNSSSRKEKYYTPNEVDAYCVYFPSKDEVCMIMYEDAPETSVTIRWEPPKNGQTRGIKMANDYML